MTETYATERLRTVYVTVKVGNAHGELVKLRKTAGTELQRTGTCEQHNRRTTAFVGINEHGWVFHCPGTEIIKRVDDEGIEHREQVYYGPHYFVNLPARKDKPDGHRRRR